MASKEPEIDGEVPPNPNQKTNIVKGLPLGQFNPEIHKWTFNYINPTSNSTNNFNNSSNRSRFNGTAVRMPRHGDGSYAILGGSSIVGGGSANNYQTSILTLQCNPDLEKITMREMSVKGVRLLIPTNSQIGTVDDGRNILVTGGTRGKAMRLDAFTDQTVKVIQAQ